MKKVLELTLVLVIIGDTLYFGGVLPLARALTEIILFGCILWILIGMAQRGRLEIRLPWAISLFVLVIIFQSVPLPPNLVRLISPARLTGPSAWVSHIGQSSWITLSIYAFATHRSLVLFLAYVAGFAIAAFTFDSWRRTSYLISGLFFLAVFESGYGLVQYLGHWYKIFNYTNTFDAGNAFGTYVNRDDFAGFLELIFPFVFGLAFYYFQWWREGLRRHADGENSMPSASGARALIYLLVLMTSMIALIFSRSRGGLLAALLSLIFIAGLAAIRQRGARGIGLLAFSGIFFCVIAYGAWIGLGPVLSRFARLSNANNLGMVGRIGMWNNTLGIIQEYPVIGSGLGSFGVAYRPFQTTLVNYYVPHAHNDYLEFAAETGVAATAVLFIGIFWLLFKMVASFWTDPRRFRSSVTIGCIGSTLSILIHSVTDFNLHIPANALIFACVLGVGYKIACIERKDEPAPGGHVANSFAH